jgi:DNA polymerase I-like protein with 3'-5' exonuclease and polymerase domains|tara:strand:+ start:279 stop:2207 length:1929 start_codon:yes stop_codon:yes gene_type:complete
MVKMNIYYVGRNVYPEFKSSTIEECCDYLKNEKIISLDIETTRKYDGRFGKGEGLDPHLTNIVMLQIGDKKRQYVIDYRVTDISPLIPLLSDPTITFVGQNIKFEYKHLFHNVGVRLEGLYDTMVVEQILFNGLNVRASLEVLNLKYLNIQVDKSTRLGFLTIGDRPFTIDEIKYGAEDILYPLLIRDKQLLDIDSKKIQNCVNLEMLFIPVLGDIEYRGMHFNQERWKVTYNENLVKVQELRDILNEYVVLRYRKTYFVKQQLDLFDNDITCNINWGSPLQVVGFFKHLDICPQATSKTTKKLTYTVNANVLRASLNTSNKDILPSKRKLIDTYLAYKELKQSCTTFGIDFFKHVNPITNRLHSNYRQVLNTGRISSSGPNLQNIPSNQRFRHAFDAPLHHKIVNADYSGQEQIILANKSLDKDLLYFYEQDLGDMHSFVASKIFPELADLSLGDIKANHKDKRQIAKAAGFAINYGGNGYTISQNLGISAEQGDKVYEAYFKAFPGLKNYFKRVQQETLKNGYILIDPITNRKSWFIKPTTPRERSKIERAALNYPIQGEAGGITKFAPILFRKWVMENKLEDFIYMTNIVHDEINVECHENYTKLASENLELCMKKAGDKWCKTIPLGAEAVITDYWNH